MTKKQDWITAWTTGKWETTNKSVIAFIANVLYHDPTPSGSDAIYDLFAAGYCYYFAVMLKTAFNRGEVVWHKGFGHIVWLDVDDIAYDIGGVFYDYGADDLVPLTELGSDIEFFKHIKEES